MAKYARKPSNSTKRRSVKRPSKSHSRFNKMSMSTRKRHGFKSIKVKTDGITASYDKDMVPSKKFGLMMAKKYWIGAKNITWSSNPVQLSSIQNRCNNLVFLYFGATQIFNLLAGDAQSGGANGTVKNTGRFYLNKLVSESLMTNSNNFNVEVTIYRMKCKKDTSSNPLTDWTAGLYDSTAQSATDYSTYYGTSPLDSVKCSQFYEIEKITHISLTPGQSHTHHFDLHLNRLLNNEYTNAAYQSSPKIECLKDVTYFELFNLRTMPSSGLTASNSNVNAPAGNLDIINTYKTEFKYINDATTNAQYLTNTLFSATAPTIYNQGSGAVIAAAAI